MVEMFVAWAVLFVWALEALHLVLEDVISELLRQCLLHFILLILLSGLFVFFAVGTGELFVAHLGVVNEVLVVLLSVTFARVDHPVLIALTVEITILFAITIAFDPLLIIIVITLV